MDLIISLPKTQRGHDAVFTVVNRFSKLVTFIPCMTSSAATDIAQLFFDYVVCNFGKPKKIISNCNPKFMSEFCTTLMVKLGTNFFLPSLYNLQTDGQSERFYILVEQILLCIIAPFQDNWDDALA